MIGERYAIDTDNNPGIERLHALARDLDTAEIAAEIRYFGNLGLSFLGMAVAVLVVAVI